MVKWAIGSFEPYKSEGPDGIFPALLQKAPEGCMLTISKIFSASLQMRHIPNLWKQVRVVFIPKSGRSDYHSTKSFRPISLSSFLLKTLERLVDRYIRDKWLKINPLSTNQHAFRTGRSTDSALHSLINGIENAKADGDSALGVFMDIEGAFDNTTIEAISLAAREKGIEEGLIERIRDLLTDRNLRADLNGVSIEAKVGKGCPQGSVISPLLWLLVIDVLLNLLKEHGFQVVGFADDIAIVVRGKFLSTLGECIGRALKIVESWCSKNELSVNPEKTRLVLFTSKRKLNAFSPPKLFDKPLQLSSGVKYLGVIIDKDLIWRSHMEHRLRKATNCFWALRRSFGNTWGLSPKVVMWFYTAIVRLFFTYGAIAWWKRGSLKLAQSKCAGLQRLASIAITGAMRTTPSSALDILLGLPSLDRIIEMGAKKSAFRLKVSDLLKPERCERLSITNKLSEVSYSDMICDWLPIEFSFNRLFNVTISEREDWSDHERLPHILKPQFWFSDGSLNDESSGAGIFREDPPLERSFNLGDCTSVFQTEIFGIMQCALEAQYDQLDEVTIC